MSLPSWFLATSSLLSVLDEDHRSHSAFLFCCLEPIDKGNEYHKRFVAVGHEGDGIDIELVCNTPHEANDRGITAATRYDELTGSCKLPG